MSKLSLDEDLIRKLADLLDEKGLSEIEIEADDQKIRLARHLQGLAAQPQALPAAVVPGFADKNNAPQAAAESPAIAGTQITSPMVGTVYLAPEPGAPSYIKPGERVTTGQTLLIVEAMKVMNALPSPVDGTIVKILVSDGQPVEFGEPLVIIE